MPARRSGYHRRMRTALTALAVLAAACSAPPSPASTDAGPAGPQVGDVERFARLPARTEGIAFGRDGAGAFVLYVGAANALWRVLPDGRVAKVADVINPVGIAVRDDGDILVCGKGEIAPGDVSAAILRVTPAGQKSVLVGPPGGERFQLTNFVAIAPDDRLVFSDSAANKLYLAEPDGTGVKLVTDRIPFPNGLAFTADGKALLVAAWDSETVYQLAREAGGYGPPTPYSTDVALVDGITTLASGAVLYITTIGVIRVERDQSRRLLSKVDGTVPANGASGRGPYGENWLYLSNLGSGEVHRLYVGEPGVPLPAR